jgi:hypothetical protein
MAYSCVKNIAVAYVLSYLILITLFVFCLIRVEHVDYDVYDKLLKRIGGYTVV